MSGTYNIFDVDDLPRLETRLETRLEDKTRVASKGESESRRLKLADLLPDAPSFASDAKAVEKVYRAQPVAEYLAHFLGVGSDLAPSKSGKPIVFRGAWISTLPDVYAAKVSGNLTRHKKAVFAVWAKRLLVDAGLVELPSIGQVASLPQKATRDEVVLWDGFKLLVGVHWLTYPGQGVTFARRFAAEWCGLSEWKAGQGWQRLRARSVLTEVGRAAGTKLWLPVGVSPSHFLTVIDSDLEGVKSRV